jgi:hypothetical protein
MVIDIDTNPVKNKQGQITYDALDLMYGWPETEKTTTPSGGFHVIYEGWGDTPHIMALGKNGLGLDIDSPNYTLIPGCVFADGTSYVGDDTPAAQCPPWIYEVIRETKGARRRNSANTNGGSDPWSAELIERALGATPYEGGPKGLDERRSYDGWITFMMSVHEACGGSSEGLNAFVNWSQNDPGYVNGNNSDLVIQDHWDSFDAGAEGGRTRASWTELLYDRRDNGPENNRDSIKVVIDKIREADNPFTTEDAASDFTEEEDEEPTPPAPAPAAPTPTPAAPTQERIYELAEIKNEFAFIISTERFIDTTNPRTIMKRTAFDAKFGYIPKNGKLSEGLFKLRKGTIRRYNDIAYRPGRPQNLPGNILNTYTQPDIKPAEGGVTWWDEHLAYLFPNAVDRDHVLDWCAWLLQKLPLKPKHALLIQGEIQGTGKSFIVEILSRILNRRNVSNLTQSDLHSDFNGWAEGSKLIIIEELRAIDRTEVANKLHPLITQEAVSINEKNLPRRDAENCFGVFAMTNHPAAIMLDNSDRRYLVVSTPAKPRDPQYYTDLYERLNYPAAIAAVAYALMNRDLAGKYNGAAAAPQTSAKTVMIDAGMTDLEDHIINHSGEFPYNARLITMEDITVNLPKHLISRGGRQYASIKEIMRRRYNAVDLDQCPLPSGKRVRLMAIGPQAAMLGQQDRKTLGTFYEADRVKALKGIPLDGSEFGEASDD